MPLRRTAQVPRPTRVRSIITRGVWSASIFVAATPMAAQPIRRGAFLWVEPVAGSDAERYLRALQVAGGAPWHQWSLRPFGADAATALPRSGAHPWQAVLRVTPDDTARAIAKFVAPEARAIFNSTFPFSGLDGDAGAVWAGKGATIAGSAGAVVRRGVLTIRLQPIVFIAQNAGFPLAPNGLSGDGQFADAIEPYSVDAPQRFGDGRYARIDPGQSTVRVDWYGVAVGASSANEIWGPAQTDPLMLGTNAAGIPRFFVGTSHPLSWGLGTFHVRLESGYLGESRYAQVPSDSSRRSMSGLVGVATIKGLPGLELGASRFFHRAWSSGSLLRGFRVPFEAFLKEQLPMKDSTGSAADNQLASIFARWAVPAAGIEAYGEYGRNDHSQDLRDLNVEPDHTAGYTVGLQRVWNGGGRRLVALRVESMNSRITHLARVRGQARWNQHDAIRQGHTQYGELLGSPSGLGGSATVIGSDVYRPDGRWTFELARRAREQTRAEGTTPDSLDVYNVLRAERLLFTRRGDVTVGAAAIHEANRDFRKDAFGLRLEMLWRAW